MGTIYSFKDEERRETVRRVRTVALQVLSAAVAVLLILALLFSMGCASSSASSQGGSTYYDDNSKDFSEASLANGVPVVFKRQQGKTAWVGLVIAGGAVLVPADKGGLEDVTLSLLLHGSARYPYSELQRMQHEQSFSIAWSAAREYALVSASFILRDLDDVLSVLGDGFLHPLLQETDFTTIMTAERQRLQREATDPSGVLGTELAAAAFEGHPYASSCEVTLQTADAISLDDVRVHHETLLNASRLAVVAVGDFDTALQKQLVSQLDATVGTVSTAPFARADVPPLTVDAAASTVYAICETAGDTGYIAGIRACPDRTTSEYVAYAIAGMYLDDLLFAQVREQHGAVYSIGSGVLGGRQLLDALSLYKATERQMLQRYVYEAVESFPDEASIAQTLDRYKNKYITTLFSSSQTVGGIAGNIVRSLIYYGSPTQYLRRAEQVQAVTATDVADVYAKYLALSADRAAGGVVNPIRWVVVSGADVVHEFVFE